MDIIAFGEVGLSGEVRGVNQPELRIKEAKKLGFTKCLLSRSNLETCRHFSTIDLIGLETIQELSDSLF
jgi:DNA repair protein RadA/Sms